MAIVFSNRGVSVGLGPEKIKNCYVIGKSWLNELLVGNISTRLPSALVLRIAGALALAVNDNDREKKLKHLEEVLKAG